MDSFSDNPKSIGRYIVHTTRIPERTARLRDFPLELNSKITEFLNSKGINKLYEHQAEMFSKSTEGNNIVITTSTASGKTLSFLLPVLQQILNNPQSRAIFIYPTKALASDQLRAIKPFLEYFGSNAINAGVYDGDTPVNERRRIRNSANIILTNPEMLNSAFLPHHNKHGYNFIFSNLKYVVIDELHTYRGAFGSHLSNLFRRLRRICNYYNSSPQFFCSSATIANPVELAETICHRKFILIDKDGSPAPEKRYSLVQPPHYGRNTEEKMPVSSLAAELIPELAVQRHSFIAFCKSRKAVEVILKESRDSLKHDGVPGADLSELISGYRAGYKAEERKEIERKMVSGQIRGLISTNALELGIDIGKIDTAVLVGYPGTKASFWQQSGRAGRSGMPSSTYLLLDNLSFDQYIAIEPDWLFNSKSETAVVDPNNLFIQLAHVRAAAAELPLTLDDISLFPDLGEIIPVLVRAKELRTVQGKYMWSGKDFPAGDYSMRNMDKERYQLINSVNNSVITELDELQAFREIHEGAIYLHDGQTYLVSRLDTENKRGTATPFGDEYYTEVDAKNIISIIKEHKEKIICRTNVKFGDVNVADLFFGYKKLQFHNHQNLGYEEISPPLEKHFDTEGMWIMLPEEVSTLFRTYRPKSFINFFQGVNHALKSAAMMLTMTTQNDISAGIIQHIDTYSVCIYDLYSGGLGYAEKAYDLIETIIKNAITMVEGCRCKDGCPACVGDYHLDKRVILWGLKSIFEKHDPPKYIHTAEPATAIIEEKPFSFDDLQEQWSEFVDFFHARGGSLSSFITTVGSVETKDNKLILHLNSDFYCTWIMEADNKIRLINSISQYVSLPVEFDIQAVSIGSQNAEHEEKIIRRYNDLKQ